MTSPNCRYFLFLIICCLSFGSAEAATTEKPAQPAGPQVITVGITEYQDVEEVYKRYGEFFRQLASVAPPDTPVTFKLAIGTYGEVLDWYNSRMVDVAILSAMPVADLLLAAQDESLKRVYLGDLNVSAAAASTGKKLSDSNEATRNDDPFKYRTELVTLNADRDLMTYEDLKQFQSQSKVKYLFVRPYSMSGYIVPKYVLSENGIKVGPGQLEFTYQHGKSLQTMMRDQKRLTANGMHVVAFVLTDTQYDPNQAADYDPSHGEVFRRIKIPDGGGNDLLDDIAIPREIIVANYHQEPETVEKNMNLMTTLLNRWKDSPLARQSNPSASIHWRPGTSNWLDDYAGVRDALQKTSLPKRSLYRSTLEDLLADLKSSKAAGHPARLALVLSGGGAKCAYQAGAIVALEQRLKDQDIDLVVGTSGGAINALLVALGVTKTDKAPAALAKTWQSFKQQQFLRPSRRFNVVFGFCFGLLQALIITVAALLFGRHSMRWMATIVFFVCVALAEIGLAVYFHVTDYLPRLLLLEACLLLLIIAGVLFVGWLIALAEKAAWKRSVRGVIRWRSTLLVTAICFLLEAIAVRNILGASFKRVGYALFWETIFLAALLVVFVGGGRLTEALNRRQSMQRLRRWLRREPEPEPNCTLDKGPQTIPTGDAFHWRKLAIVLMVFFSAAELLIAKSSFFEDSLSKLFVNRWFDHLWTLVVLISVWSFPYPLALAILMLFVGTLILPGFNWNRARESVIWWTTLVLIVMTAFVVTELFFKESSPSKAEGIEEAFTTQIPALLEATLNPKPTFSAADKASLAALSRRIMDENLLQRDLIITTSKLPLNHRAAKNFNSPRRAEAYNHDVDVINGLPEDIYFYFKKRGNLLKPPPDPSFVPLESNEDKLLDIVMASSTIYPIFPSRPLKNLRVGVEETHSSVRAPLEPEVRFIDGGFIHNIPLKAAIDWGATHIILIDASPNQEQLEPSDFVDNLMMAFGYLFSQAQRSDTGSARGHAEIFQLRPTSPCEKQNVKPICTSDEEGGRPDPDLDTFDFSENAAGHAFQKGEEDMVSTDSLFMRLPGESPDAVFRTVTASGFQR